MRVAAVVCVATLTFTSGAARAQPDRIDMITTRPNSALTGFWTEQRLQGAQPMPLPVVNTDGRVEAPSSALSGSGGPSELVPGEVARLSGDVRAKPLYWAGKLVAAINENYVTFCSAQLVAPDVVVTAVHCIRNNETGAWYQPALYRHQYERGKGRDLNTQCLLTYSGWVSRNQDRYRWDYAMIKLLGTIDQGYFGLEYGWQGKYRSASKIGYPSQIERGEVIQVEFGSLIRGWAPYVVGLNHGNPNSGKGSSGGAWVGAYDPNANNPRANVVISVVSHSINNNDRIDYGPAWDQKMLQLLNQARSCRSS